MAGDLSVLKTIAQMQPNGWISKIGIPAPWPFAVFVVALISLLTAGYLG